MLEKEQKETTRDICGKVGVWMGTGASEATFWIFRCFSLRTLAGASVMQSSRGSVLVVKTVIIREHPWCPQDFAPSFDPHNYSIT